MFEGLAVGRILNMTQTKHIFRTLTVNAAKKLRQGIT